MMDSTSDDETNDYCNLGHDSGVRDLLTAIWVERLFRNTTRAIAPHVCCSASGHEPNAALLNYEGWFSLHGTKETENSKLSGSHSADVKKKTVSGYHFPLPPVSLMVDWTSSSIEHGLSCSGYHLEMC